MSEEHGDDFWAINKEDIHVIFVHTIIQQRTEDNRLLDWKKNNLAGTYITKTKYFGKFEQKILIFVILLFRDYTKIRSS